jgi:hypothetical protein
MPGKIFYRERVKVGEGEKKPRFRMVAIADLNLKIYGEHLRRSELEQIADAVGAELILLKPDTEGKYEEDDAEVEVEVED